MSGEDEEENGFLETSRLILRRPRLDDAAALAALVNNPRVVENTARLPYPYGEDDARQWIASPLAECEARFAILLKPPRGTFIGVVGFDRLEDGDAPDLGYWLGEPHWGNGFATEAARAVVDFAFLSQDFRRLAAGCRVTNAASGRVLEKCGFQYCGDDMMESRFSAAPSRCAASASTAGYGRACVSGATRHRDEKSAHLFAAAAFG